MAVDFRFIIIGRGMMGAAAARHLSAIADGIALIGPREPAERKSHDGVFASHYDEARITRTFDGNLAWGSFAARARPLPCDRGKQRHLLLFGSRLPVCSP